MPLIRAQKPDFKLTLLGKDPSPEMQELADKPNSGVKITGLVDDTRPYLTAASVFVCPLRSGSGTRFKILEAMACGCPVVSTTLGAEGLGAVDGRHLLLADTPRAFANAVLKLLDQPDDASRLSRFGRQWVVERHSWGRSASFSGRRLREPDRQLGPDGAQPAQPAAAAAVMRGGKRRPSPLTPLPSATPEGTPAYGRGE